MTNPRARISETLPIGTPADSVPPEPPREEPGFSAIALLNLLLRYRWLMLISALIGGFYAGYRSITSPRLYISEAQFMPKGAQGQVGGLAQQFGITMGGDVSQSPQFYTDLMKSRPLLAQVAEKQYSIRLDTGLATGDLFTILKPWGQTETERRHSVVQTLRGMTEVTFANRTSVITLKVWAIYPDLAYQVAQHMISEVNAYNLERRQQSAAAERAFIEQRVAEAQAELRQAEGNLQGFLTENREFRSSPSLQLEFDRLNRQVGFRQQLYNQLAQAYEQARIEEVRDLPVVTVLEPPELPFMPEKRGGVRRTAIGLLLGAFAGLLIGFLRERLAENRERYADDFAEYAALKQEALGDLTHPWRPIGRVMRARRKR